MPEKRKKDESGGKKSKKSRNDDGDKEFTSYMMSNYSSDVLIGPVADDDSDSDSDGDVPVFDLPSFGAFGEEEPKPEEPSSSSKGGVIFLSDPSQLPTPISFSGPTMMNPVLLGSGKKTQSQVMLTNQTVSPGNAAKLVGHVQPVVLPVTPKTSTPNPKQNVTHMKIAASHSNGNMMSVGSKQQIQMTRPSPAVASTSKAGSRTSVQPVSSATNIMQQVMAAAQQAAMNIRASSTSTVRPTRPITRPNVTIQAQRNVPAQPQRNSMNIGPNRPQHFSAPNNRQAAMNAPRMNVATRYNNSQQQQQRFQRPNIPQTNNRGGRAPLVNGNIRSGSVIQSRVPGPAAVNDNATSKKWRPYSDILNKLSRKLTRESARKLGINPNMPLNLKQMYTLLRSKFATNQIFDMCMWDMEHPDASLLEIAITNAFT